MNVRIRLVLVCICFLSLVACRSRKGTQSSASKATHSSIKEIDIEPKLKKEIQAWLGTPYLFGGNTPKGVDCSGFVQAIFRIVYRVELPRTSKAMYSFCKKIKESDLKEGDLVFFNYEGKGVSHVGIYLGDNSYVHASSSKGVIISRLDADYARKKYVGAGRVKH